MFITLSNHLSKMINRCFLVNNSFIRSYKCCFKSLEAFELPIWIRENVHAEGCTQNDLQMPHWHQEVADRNRRNYGCDSQERTVSLIFRCACLLASPIASASLITTLTIFCRRMTAFAPIASFEIHFHTNIAQTATADFSQKPIWIARNTLNECAGKQNRS